MFSKKEPTHFHVKKLFKLLLHQVNFHFHGILNKLLLSEETFHVEDKELVTSGLYLGLGVVVMGVYCHLLMKCTLLSVLCRGFSLPIYSQLIRDRGSTYLLMDFQTYVFMLEPLENMKCIIITSIISHAKHPGIPLNHFCFKYF